MVFVRFNLIGSELEERGQAKVGGNRLLFLFIYFV